MSAAQKLATRRAIESLTVTPDVAITDGKWDFVSPSVANVELAVKADLRCLSVATASVLAKVVRDRLMRELAESYPHWSFDTNKGYPCPGAQGGNPRVRPISRPPAQLGLSWTTTTRGPQSVGRHRRARPACSERAARDAQDPPASAVSQRSTACGSARRCRAMVGAVPTLIEMSSPRSTAKASSSVTSSPMKTTVLAFMV